MPKYVCHSISGDTFYSSKKELLEAIKEDCEARKDELRERITRKIEGFCEAIEENLYKIFDEQFDDNYKYKIEFDGFDDFKREVKEIIDESRDILDHIEKDDYEAMISTDGDPIDYGTAEASLSYEIIAD